MLLEHWGKPLIVRNAVGFLMKQEQAAAQRPETKTVPSFAFTSRACLPL